MADERVLEPATPGEGPRHEDVQQLIEAESGQGTQGIRREWLAADSDKTVLISDAAGVRISPNNGTTPPAGVMVVGATAGGVLSGTYPSPGFAPAPTFTGPVQINGALTVTGQTTLAGLAAQATTVTTLTATGQSTLQGLQAAGAQVTTLGVTSNATVSGTLTVSQQSWLKTVDIDGDLHVAGASILGSTSSSPVQVPGTLLVVNEAQFQGSITHTGTFLGVFNTAPTTKKTVTGSRGSNAALASLCTALAAYGLIVNNTS